jgi:hypothetical protein
MEQIVEKTVEIQNNKSEQKVNVKNEVKAQPNRRERRQYLRKNSNYFTSKKHLNLNDWTELIKSNLKNGKAQHEARVNLDMERTEIFLKDRENKLIELYKSQGLSKEEIDMKMNKWYEEI